MNAGDGWIKRPGYTPIMQLEHADGHRAGMGYMEVWGHRDDAHVTIAGREMVRQTFTIPTSRAISTVWLRVARAHGDDPLSVRVVDDSGVKVAAGAIPADAFEVAPVGNGSGGGSWTPLTFDAPVSLRGGESYNLILSTRDTSLYWLYVLRRGASYGYDDATYFAGGSAQVRVGSGWVAPLQDGGRRLDEADIQFTIE
jgi:hypothetical protein